MRYIIASLIVAMFAAEIYAQLQMDLCRPVKYGRGFGHLPDDCGDGNEYDAGLCYPNCQDGYYGVGPVCWAFCPENTTDIGAFCTKGWQISAKKSYGRGVGKIPHCNATAFENQAGLCYTRCKENYVAFGPVCLNNAGDAGHSVKCSGSFLFGATETDCRNFKIELGIIVGESVGCVSEIIEWINNRTNTVSAACTQAAGAVKSTIANVKPCA